MVGCRKRWPTTPYFFGRRLGAACDSALPGARLALLLACLLRGTSLAERAAFGDVCRCLPIPSPPSEFECDGRLQHSYTLRVSAVLIVEKDRRF